MGIDVIIILIKFSKILWLIWFPFHSSICKRIYMVIVILSFTYFVIGMKVPHIPILCFFVVYYHGQCSWHGIQFYVHICKILLNFIKKSYNSLFHKDLQFRSPIFINMRVRCCGFREAKYNTPVLTLFALNVDDVYIVINRGVELKEKAPPLIWLCYAWQLKSLPIVYGDIRHIIVLASCKYRHQIK